MTGRPTIFTQSLADEICKAISTSTDGIMKMCRERPEWPSHQAINEWRLLHKSFGDQYARAKQVQADLMVEEILEASKDSSSDTFIDADGNTRSNMAAIQRARLVADNVKWVASKLMPKVYGDRQQVDSTVTITHEDTLKDLS